MSSVVFSPFFPRWNGKKRRKKYKIPFYKNVSNFGYLHFGCSHFFLFSDTGRFEKKKNGAIFLTYFFFWVLKTKNLRISRRKKKRVYLWRCPLFFLSVSHISRKRKLLYLEVGAKTFYRSRKSGDWYIRSLTTV